MLLSATLVVLGFWLTIVWYFDIDGFRRHRRREMPHDDQRDEKATRCDRPEER